MKALLLMVIASALIAGDVAPPAAPLPANAASRESIIELLTLEHRLGDGKRMARSALEQIIKGEDTGARLDQPSLEAAATELGAEFDHLVEAMAVPMWRRRLDQSAADAAIAFYRSESGKHYVVARDLAQDDVSADGTMQKSYTEFWGKLKGRYDALVKAADERAAKDAEKSKKDGF